MQSCTERAPSRPSGNSVLLVVDDYPENLVTLKAVLDRHDWSIVTASSGMEALDVMLSMDIDLVLLDVQMPGMDGFEVARLMRGSQRTRLTPIIFLTANEHSLSAVHKGYASGAVDYLFKPFDPDVLRPKVQALLEQQHSRRMLQRLTHELEAARAFNASVLANVAEGILVVQESGRISFANPAICRLLGATDEALCDTDVLDYFIEPRVEDWRHSGFYLHYLDAETYRVHDAVLRTPRGRQVPVAISCAPLPAEQKAMVLSVLDMSVVRDLYRQLEHQAVTDALTGLLNRRGFHQTVQGLLLRKEHAGKHLALLYIDLDGFKRINDSLGHDAGDQVLVWVAEQLKGCLRPHDILGRMGGDEFTVLIDGIDHPEHAARVAEKLIERVSARHPVNGVDTILGASIGIATWPDCGDTLDGLMRAADIAMYEAKHAGRQQYRFYDQSMNGRARSRLMLEESVERGIDGREFSMVYQPQIFARSGLLRGFEALLRWKHPAAGDVPPGLFIPLLEETRLINKLGGWIFEQVASQRSQWHQAFPETLILSVSLSPAQFSMPNLASELQRAMHLYGLSPNQLEVEITESALLHNPNHTHRQLGELKAIGVRASLDDFGAQVCSLSHVRAFELDTLKLDRHFMAGLMDSPKDQVIAASVIDMCGRLGIDVIAEGVETEAQYAWLTAHGCEVIQGFLVAHPMTMENALAFEQPFAAARGWSRPAGA